MARKTFVEFVDDTTGDAADETVTFGLDGVTYEIDLTAKNAAKMRETLDGYVSAARRVGGRRKAGRPAGRSDAAKVRAWAAENGYEVGDRGRVPAEVREAYQAAQ